MAKRFFVDLPSEGVSESTFSIHANFATDLRANADPASISDMVFCHQNDAWLYGYVKDKVKKLHLINSKYGFGHAD